MKQHSQILLLLILAAIFSACGPTPPTEAELREKIIGEFCAENYRLEITDSTYRNIKRTPSVMRTGMVRESCKGKFKLEYRDNAWFIDFAKDESPNAIFNCKRSYPVWTKETEYVMGADGLEMKDLFDEKVLKKSNCD